MPPEHVDIEADWLASELKRATEYARTAYETEEAKVRQLFLANLIGTLDTLYTHYKVYPTEDGQQEPLYAPQPNHGRKRRGPVMRLLFGDN